MVKNKKSFIMYADYLELFEELSDEDAGQLIKHILRYINNQEPITTNVIVKISFIPIKQSLKRDLKKFEVIKEKRSAAGKRSAEIRAAKAVGLQQKKINPTNVESVEQTSTNPTDNDNVNDNVNDNDVYYTIPDLKIRYLKNKRVVKAVVENTTNKFKNEKHLEEQLEKFEKELLQRGEKVKTESDFAFHFRNWNKKQKSSCSEKPKKIKLNASNPNK